MSTIAYRDGVLAADTQICNYGTRVGSARKIGRTADGCLWAFVGQTHRQAACVEWADKRRGDPPEIKESAFVLITLDGTPRTWYGDGWATTDDPWPAWGSGERIARGAMFVGATAAEAVRASIAIDTESGGEVTVLRLEPPT